MNKPFHTLYGRLGAALLLLIIAFIVHSCRKELSRRRVNNEIISANYLESDANDWYNRNMAALAINIITVHISLLFV